MDVTVVVPEGRQFIQAYHEGGFRIAGVRHRGSVLVLPERTLPWPVGSLGEVTLEALEPITAAAGAIDFLVLGCGPRFAMVSSELRRALKELGIVVESMDTRAACRTFNVVLADERRAAAALIAL